LLFLREKLCVRYGPPSTARVRRPDINILCRSHGLRPGPSSGSSTCYNISYIPDFLNYLPKVKMVSMIINCLRERYIPFQTRSFSKYSTAFDKPSNRSLAMRGLGTATEAGSSLRMYAENGDISCSRHLHVCTFGSSSQSVDPEERLQLYVSRPCR
jgi:hypothetical protein